MLETILGAVQRFGVKRFVALVLAPGFVARAVAVAADHLADRTVEHPAQISGVVAPMLCALLLVAIALPRLGPVWFRRLSWTTAVLSILTGVVGTWFHLVSLVDVLGDDRTWDGLLETLTVTPPVFAPFAFVGLGVLLVALGSERLAISVEARAPAQAPEPAAAPQA